MRSLFIVMIICLSMNAALGEEVKFLSPSNDTIVIGDTITARGTAAPSSGNPGQVMLRVGAQPYQATVHNGLWQVSNVQVPPGMQVWTVSLGQQSDKLLVTRGVGIRSQPSQKVQFVWTEGTNGAQISVGGGLA